MKGGQKTAEVNEGGLKSRCSCISKDNIVAKHNCAANTSKYLPLNGDCSTKVISYYSPMLFSFSQMTESIELNHNHSNLKFWKQRDAHESTYYRNENLLGDREDHNRGEKLEILQVNEMNKSDCTLQASNLQGDEVRNSIIELLRSKLLKSRFFSINELHKMKNVRMDNEIAFSPQGMERISTSLKKMTSPQFLSLCTGEKHASKSIQNFIEASDCDRIQHVFSLIIQTTPDLIMNPLGNYVLQVAAQRSEAVASNLEEYCKHNLEYLCSNEYASRVMQSLVEISSNFRRTVLEWACLNLGLLLETLPSVFLLTAALMASRHPAELASVRETLLSSNAKQYSHHRYFKRILMSFIDKCSFDDIALVCNTYRINRDFYGYLNDKFGAFILIAVIRRGFKPTTDILLNAIKEDMIGLYHTKFFKFVFYRLAKESYLRRPILEAILGMGNDNMRAATDSKASCLFFCYLVVSVATEDLLPTSLHFKKVVHSQEQLRGLLFNFVQQFKLRDC